MTVTLPRPTSTRIAWMRGPVAQRPHDRPVAREGRGAVEVANRWRVSGGAPDVADSRPPRTCGRSAPSASTEPLRRRPASRRSTDDARPALELVSRRSPASGRPPGGRRIRPSARVPRAGPRVRFQCQADSTITDRSAASAQHAIPRGARAERLRESLHGIERIGERLALQRRRNLDVAPSTVRLATQDDERDQRQGRRAA